MSDLRIDLNTLLGAKVGERLEFERTVPAPQLKDLSKPESLTVSGYVEALDNRWLVSGSTALSVELTCARCLKEFRKTVEADFSEEFSRTPDGDQFPAEETRIELTDMLRSVLVLALPDRPLHSPDCKGLCPVCGQDLNERPHTHPEPAQPKENPFSALKKKR